MENKNREKLLLIAVGVCIGIYAIVSWAVDPLIDSWHARTGEIAALTKQISEANRLKRYGDDIHDKWDFMRGNALSPSATTAEREMFNAFHRWVDVSGVAPGSFRPQVPDSDTNFTTVDCRSDVSGSLTTVRDFLRNMSRDPMSDKVDSFELTSKDDNGTQLVLGMNTSGLILLDNDPTKIVIPASFTNEPPVDTNAPDLYKIIARNNIFDQSRVDRGERPPTVRPRVPVVETLSAHGTGTDTNGDAFFEGTGISSSKFYPKGATVGDFKLTKVGFTTVTLVDSSSNTFVLPTDGSASLRREDAGPWHLVGYVPPTENHDTNSTAASSSSSGTLTIEEKLRRRRLEAQ